MEEALAKKQPWRECYTQEAQGDTMVVKVPKISTWGMWKLHFADTHNSRGAPHPLLQSKKDC